MPEYLEDLRKALARGQKRIRYRELEPDQANVTLEQENMERNPRKRRKENAAAGKGQETDVLRSPEPGVKSPEPDKQENKQQSPETFTELRLRSAGSNWSEGRADRKVPARKSPARKSPGMSPSKRTPVRIRVQRLENRVQKLKMKPVRTPTSSRKAGRKMDQDPTQRKIQEFLYRSPPGSENLPQRQQETVSKAGKAGKYIKGATSGPLLGVLGCRTSRKPSHGGPGPPTVECGGLVGNRGRKRTFTALEKWLSGQPNNSEQQGRPGSSNSWSERKGDLARKQEEKDCDTQEK